MDGIINDMDLALEGVTVSNSNRFVQTGLAILEHQFPNFSYSNDDLSLNEKVNEMRQHCLLMGYHGNDEILSLISSYQTKLSNRL